MKKNTAKKISYLGAAIGALLLAGCASQNPAPIIDANGAIGPTGPDSGSNSSAVETHGVDIGSGFNSEMINDGHSYSEAEHQKLSQTISTIMSSDSGHGNVIYFGFAQDNLSAKAQEKANAIAKLLVEFPKQKVQIAGNTDPIGPTSYNFTLGQNRANAVYNYLLSQGVASTQVCTVSYGSTQSIVDAAMIKSAGCQLAAGKPTATFACKKAYRDDRRAVVNFGATCSGEG